MNKFVKYIIYKMHTIDGKKDTAVAILQAMSEQFRRTQFQSLNKKVDKQQMQKLEIRNEIHLLSMTYLKYLVIKFR